MIDAQSLAAGLVLAAEAMLRRRRTGIESGGVDEFPALDQAVAQLPDELHISPELTFSYLTVGTQPTKILDVNPSPRRHVLIQNRHATAVLRAANRPETLQAGGGIALLENDVLIDEPPHPHGGEWWAVSNTAATPLTVADSR